MPGDLKLVIADGQTSFRCALKHALAGIAENTEILEAGSVAIARSLLAQNDDLDLVLLELDVPGACGLTGLIALRDQNRSVPMLVVSAHDDPIVVRCALTFGAAGFVSKAAGVDEIRCAVEKVLAGLVVSAGREQPGPERDPAIADLIRRLLSLTPQQTRVLGQVAAGLLNKQIAYRLGVSEATVKAHVSAILEKLGVRSRAQAVMLLSRLGAEPPGAPR